MKACFILAAVLAFASFSQAAKTTQLPIKTIVNEDEGVVTMIIDGSSITFPISLATYAQIAVSLVASLQAAPIPYISVDTSIDATLKATDKSLTLSALGVNLNVPASSLDPIRSILEVALKVIAPPPKTSG